MLAFCLAYCFDEVWIIGCDPFVLWHIVEFVLLFLSIVFYCNCGTKLKRRKILHIFRAGQQYYQ